MGDEFRLRAVRKPRDGTRHRGDLLSILAWHADSGSDQKTKNPDSTLVRVASLRSLVHCPFRITADRCQPRTQIAVEILLLSAGCHGCKIRLVVRTGATPVNQSGLGGKFRLRDQCFPGEGREPVGSAGVALLVRHRKTCPHLPAPEPCRRLVQVAGPSNQIFHAASGQQRAAGSHALHPDVLRIRYDAFAPELRCFLRLGPTVNARRPIGETPATAASALRRSSMPCVL